MKRVLSILALLAVLTTISWGQGDRVQRVQEKSSRVQQLIPDYVRRGGSAEEMKALGLKVKRLGQAGRLEEAEAVLDQMLGRINSQNRAPGSSWKELVVRGDSPGNGIYDPSLEYDDQGVGWLAYSAVSGAGTRAGKVETHLARSDDRGQTWTYVTALNRAMPDTLNGERGMWWNEVSTLVHDPDDPGHQWKLFYHHYFAKMPYRGAQDRRLQYGWIAYKTAPSPEGPWSAEEALFGAGVFPAEPFEARIKLSELSSYFVLTEPGSLYFEGKLYLSLQAIRLEGDEPRFDVVLLVSEDHGRHWRYLATSLKAGLAKRYGGDGWTGSSLAVEQGRIFLMVCPELHERPRDGHRGTLAFEFTDLGRGRLDPEPRLHLKPELAKGGQSDYDERNEREGPILPQTDPRHYPRLFRLYRTEKRLVR